MPIKHLSSFSHRLLFSLQHFVGSMLIISLLASCSAIGGAALNALAGGGPSASANVQAGKTNTQTVGSSTVDNRKLEVRTDPESSASVSQDNSTTNNITLPFWAVLLIVTLAAGGAVGWIDNITRFFLRWKRKNNGRTSR